MADTRNTEPGVLLKAYNRAKAKAQSAFGRGKAEAKAIVSGAPKDDPVTAGDSWKDNTPKEEVSEADEVRSQEEMKETFGDGDSQTGDDRRRDARTDLPDGTATMTAEDIEAAAPDSAEDGADRTGDDKVEIASPQMREGRGLDASDNPAAPGENALDKAALAKLREAEEGEMPSEGLGLDDGPRVHYPGDVGR